MIKRFTPTPYTVALLGGATISLIPSLAVTKLAQAFPSLKPQELGIVSEFFANGIGPLQAILFMCIIFVIPPIEELIFREWGWGLVSRYLSPERTWVFTSILFALVHLEPLHVLGLLPLSLFLGWLRLETGDIRSSIVAHCTNNAVACLLMVI